MAAQATFALTHPSNLGEIASVIASAAGLGRDGLRHGVGRAPARLADGPVAQEREEDPGEPAREGHDGDTLAPSHRDPRGLCQGRSLSLGRPCLRTGVMSSTLPRGRATQHRARDGFREFIVTTLVVVAAVVGINGLALVVE